MEESGGFGINELLKKILEKSVEERAFDIAYQKTRKTTEYDKWVTESISLSSGIVKLLGPDRTLFDRYEELASSRESAFIKNTYQQGFMDGIELLKTLLYEGKRIE